MMDTFIEAVECTERKENEEIKWVNLKNYIYLVGTDLKQIVNLKLIYPDFDYYSLGII